MRPGAGPGKPDRPGPCDLALEIDQRIYELTAVCWPSGVAGRLRAFTLEELELAAAWGQAFDREALPPSEWRTVERAREMMIPRIEAGMLFGMGARAPAGGHRGKQPCVLYTDLANPTSNAIYQRIGYPRGR